MSTVDRDDELTWSETVALARKLRSAVQQMVNRFSTNGFCVLATGFSILTKLHGVYIYILHKKRNIDFVMV